MFNSFFLYVFSGIVLCFSISMPCISSNFTYNSFVEVTRILKSRQTFSSESDGKHYDICSVYDEEKGQLNAFTFDPDQGVAYTSYPFKEDSYSSSCDDGYEDQKLNESIAIRRYAEPRQHGQIILYKNDAEEILTQLNIASGDTPKQLTEAGVLIFEDDQEQVGYIDLNSNTPIVNYIFKSCDFSTGVFETSNWEYYNGCLYF